MKIPFWYFLLHHWRFEITETSVLFSCPLFMFHIGAKIKDPLFDRYISGYSYGFFPKIRIYKGEICYMFEGEKFTHLYTLQDVLKGRIW